MQHITLSFPLQVFIKKEAFILMIILLCVIVLSSWNLLNTVISYYAYTVTASSSSTFWWSAVYASLAVGMIFGLMSMVVALAVALPAIVVIWSTVLVLLSICGKHRMLVEGRKLTAEMSRSVGMVVVKEGELVAVVCAVCGYFLFVRYGMEHVL